MKFIEKFRRITSSGEYFAEIDGLRFIAIFSVVLFHITSTVKSYTVDSLQDNVILGGIYKNGWQGVELFFVISGFIIGLPFAKHYFNGDRKVKLKSYFLRRVTRLEPPYFLALILFFFIQIIGHQITFSHSFPSLLASMIYSHNIIFNNQNYLIISVLWSLEVEIQFYILAIIFVRIFKLNKFYRRFFLLLLIAITPIAHHYYFPSTPTIYTFLHFFFIGFLLVDLYLDKSTRNFPKLLSIIIGFISLVSVLYINYKSNLLNEYIYIIGIFVFYYSVLINGFANKFFTNKYISVIGGMCYTIYLIHAPIVSAFSHISKYLVISNHYLPNLLLNTAICIPIVLVPSAIYFRYIEKPCMDKNWPKKLAVTFRHLFNKDEAI
jgi:peptidoglycan/LPS O-acetylase OafA/YrhL